MGTQATTLALIDTARADVANIGGGPPPPTITNATATPSSLAAPGPVSIDATVQNQTSISVDNVVVASLPTVVQVAVSRSIPISATGPGGSASTSVSVTVATPPPGDLSWFTSKASGSITNVPGALLSTIDVSNGRILSASGQLYIPWLGRAGWIIIRGGGHSDYNGNDILAIDLFTGQVMRLKARYTNLFVGPNGYHADAATGLLWANAAGTATVPGEYSSGHTYGQAVALLPGFGTNDPLGAALYTGIPSLTPNGQRHGMSCFTFDFSTNQYAPFAGPMPLAQPEYSHSFIDVGRRRVLIHGTTSSNAGSLIALNVDTRAYSTVNASMPTSVSYMVWGHDLANDLYVGMRPVAVGYPPALYVIDPNTGAFTAPGLTTAWPWPAGVSYSGGGFWSESKRAFYYYHGQGEQSIRSVKPPAANPRTTPWTVQVISFSGDASPADTMVGAGAHCKRFMPMENTGGALWLGSTIAPAQFWKY